MKDGDFDSRRLLQEIDEVIGDAILLLIAHWRDRNDQQVAHLAEVIADMFDLWRRLVADMQRQQLKQRRSRR